MITIKLKYFIKGINYVSANRFRKIINMYSAISQLYTIKADLSILCIISYIQSQLILKISIFRRVEVKIASVQINTKIGDFEANREKILNYTKKALSAGADIAVFPELSVCGYPPLDLLDQSAFYEKNIESLRWLQKNIPEGIAAVIGHVGENSSFSGKPYYNCATVIKDKAVIHTQEKTLLPTYDVFDESRYFESSSERKIFEYEKIKIGIAVCEDLWCQSSVGKQERYQIDPVKELLDKGAELIISPSASPFFAGKTKDRLDLLETISRRGGVNVVYVNSIGGNDSIVFDGNSMITDKKGNLLIQSKSLKRI